MVTGEGAPPLRLIFGEALRNLGASLTLPAVQLIFLTAVGVGVLSIDLNSVQTMLAEQRRFVDEGGYVYVARQSVDGLACRDLASLDVVRRVGGATDLGVRALSVQPGRPIPVIGVSGDSPSIWANSPLNREEPYIGTVLADDLSETARTRLSFLGGDAIQVSGIVPSERYAPTARALILPIPWTARIDECWVEFVAIDRNLAASLMGTVATGPEMELNPLVTPSPGVLGLRERFEQRLTQWLWVVGASFTMLLAILAQVARRPESALYRILGWRTRDLILGRLWEFLVLQSLARVTALGLVVGVAASAGDASRFELSLAINLVVLLAGAELLGVLVAITIVQPRNLVATLRSV